MSWSNWVENYPTSYTSDDCTYGDITDGQVYNANCISKGRVIYFASAKDWILFVDFHKISSLLLYDFLFHIIILNLRAVPKQTPYGRW